MVTESDHASTELEKMSAAERARGMLIDLAGPRDWADNKKALISRAARRAHLTFRRAKSILYNEKRLSLGADEYLQIERLWRAAAESVQATENMDRAARAIADSAAAMGERAELVRDAGAQIARAKALAGECGAAASGAAVREEGTGEPMTRATTTHGPPG